MTRSDPDNSETPNGRDIQSLVNILHPVTADPRRNAIIRALTIGKIGYSDPFRIGGDVTLELTGRKRSK